MDSEFVRLAGSERPRKHEAERIGDVDPASKVEVTVTLRGAELPALDAEAPPMSRAELERSYGADGADVAKVKSALEPFGLTVDKVSTVGRSVQVSGTAAQIEAAFHAGLGVYRSAAGHEFRGRGGTLQIPAALDGIVTGVFGLDQRRVARRADAAADARAAATAALGPADLEHRYNFPPGTGEGQTIAIAEFGGTYFPQDLATFCKQHELSPAKVSVVDVGLEPVPPSEVERLPEEQRQEVLEASGEVMMDIEIVSGLCPQAEIVVYFATFDQKGWIDLLDEVIAGKPTAASVLSVSWGLAEDSTDWSRAAVEEVNQRLQAAAHLGMTVCVASGDDGSGDQLQDGHAHVNVPASSPFVLSVGGTMIEDGSEVVWWQSPGQRQDGGGATGGGVSVIFERPPWQTVAVPSLNKGGIDGRVVPDIAALAGPPYYDLVMLGERQPSGGTSAATPVWAALLARIRAAGKPSSGSTFLPPLLYAGLSGGKTRGEATCADITEGHNASSPHPGKGYEAAVGYDAVGGWGVPDGEELLASLP
jgi:kumamolisin